MRWQNQFLKASTRIGRAILASGLAGVLTISAAAAEAPENSGTDAPDFSLLDLRGRNHELQRAGGRAVVLFFTGTGCPIARKNAAKLRPLEDRFGREGVSFWIINSYADEKLEDMAKEYNELRLWGLPYLCDSKQCVAQAFGVQRTAEVVALSTENWRVFYRGAIDDQYSEGAERAQPLDHYLEQALQEFLAGKTISVSSTRAHGCLLGFTSTDHAPSYADNVAPILRRHCVECHREGDIGPWVMNGYGPVKRRASMIQEVLLTRRMPPWDPDPRIGRFTNANAISREEAQTLLRWVQQGAPRGEGPDPLTESAPAPDWPLGRPDVVLRLPEVQQIPATGVLEYRHLRIPSPFTNDVWVMGADIKPGNRRVVHHVILYAKWPGCADDGTGNGVHFCGWAPGCPPLRLPAGVGQRLPAGAELTAEVHYTTCGSPQTDQSEIALYLAAEPQAKEAEIRRAVETDLSIPPGSDEARHVATYAFRHDATIYSLMPHMHFRGKWMRYQLLLPDGTSEMLLSVPRYDFNWQFSYQLAEPRHVPAGSWLLVTGAFDNSPGNPANPDASKRVGFGLQSWDEMFIGFFVAADDAAPGGQVPMAQTKSQ